MKNLISLSRQLGRVKRFQVYNLFHEYSVAEHSYRVAILAYSISKGVEYESELGIILTKALFHDLEEGLLGDFPGPLKKKLPTFNEEYDKLATTVMEEYIQDGPVLYNWEFAKKGIGGDIIHLADNLEAFQTVVEEVEAGNLALKPLLERFIVGLEKTYPSYMVEKYPNAVDILTNLVSRAKEL